MHTKYGLNYAIAAGLLGTVTYSADRRFRDKFLDVSLHILTEAYFSQLFLLVLILLRLASQHSRIMHFCLVPHTHHIVSQRAQAVVR